MTARETAEKYIRWKLPELMELRFGCAIGNSRRYSLVYVGYSNAQHALSLIMDGEESMLFVDKVNPGEVIGHPIQLQHWLRVLGEPIQSIGTQKLNDELEMCFGHKNIRFNLTTGQPATETDYQAFNAIVGV